MAAFKAHCALGVLEGVADEDIPTDIGADAMGQFGRLESLDDMPSEAALVRMVREAAALNDAGVKVARARRRRSRRPRRRPTCSPQ